MAVITFLTGWLVFLFVNENVSAIEERNYIAHAGGEIDGFTYTNSKEAVEHSIGCGIKYIELDLILTADSILVAAHSWHDYNKMTGNSDLDFVPTLKQFKSSKLHGKYTTLSIMDVDSILHANPGVVLVTDKMSNPAILEKYIQKYRERTIVECMSDEDYYYFMDQGYRMSMYRGGKNIVKQFVHFAERKLRGKSNRYSACVVHVGDQDKINCKCKFVYGVKNRQQADSVFCQNEDVKFIYVDNVE
ncbi:MAG: hypothetical protein MJZ74_03010 [Muribaculaceae bacterium]|nr:hypothetical protein [Muribaculaceae bacterium]